MVHGGGFCLSADLLRGVGFQFDPGLCPLDSDRDADHNAGLEISGTSVWVQICQIPDFGLSRMDSQRMDSQGGFSKGDSQGWILKGDSQRGFSRGILKGDSRGWILKGWILNCWRPTGRPAGGLAQGPHALRPGPLTAGHPSFEYPPLENQSFENPSFENPSSTSQIRFKSIQQ